MDRAEIDRLLADTLEDHFLSRSEKRALKDVLAEHCLDPNDLAYWRHRAFEMARERIGDTSPLELVEWLEDVVKVLVPVAEPAGPEASATADARFSPGDACLSRIGGALESARREVDICVFTITDNRLTDAILGCHRRGVRVRVVSDDDKSTDRGSDVERLAAAGVPVRKDRSEHHMHHKFAVFDRSLLVTGSYNWTRSAAEHNRENIVVTDDARLVAPFVDAFEELWQAFG